MVRELPTGGNMTDNGPEGKSTESGDSKQRWVAEVQDALDRTGDALRTAWEATRESRMSALESAKQAAQELGEVIDKGIAAAKERWAALDQEVDEVVDKVEESPLVEEVVAKEPIVVESEPIPTSGDVTVTPVESDPTDQG
jgi:hypothetical protein